MEVAQLMEGPPRDQVYQLQGLCQPGIWRWRGQGQVLEVGVHPVLALDWALSRVLYICWFT